MSDSNHYDVIVIGGGPIGLSAAYECAKAGKSVLVLERFNFFNQSGSSNDLVRMFRTMYTQDFMADLAKAFIGIWRELETDAAEQLILMTGLLNFGDPNYGMEPEGNLLDPIKNLARLKMPYRRLTAKEIMAEYPFKDLPANFEGIYAPVNGCINVPLGLRSLYRLAQSYGAKLVAHARIRHRSAQVEDLAGDRSGWSVLQLIIRPAPTFTGLFDRCRRSADIVRPDLLTNDQTSVRYRSAEAIVPTAIHLPTIVPEKNKNWHTASNVRRHRLQISRPVTL